MTARGIALALALAGCGADLTAGPDVQLDAGGGPSDAPTPLSCNVALTVNPPSPVAGPTTMIRVTSHVDHAPGVLHYDWHVQLNGTPIDFTPAQSDDSEIQFRAAFAGTYLVTLNVTGAVVYCAPIGRSIDVSLGGGTRQRVRLRVVPPSGIAPPIEQLRDLDAGVTSLGILSIDRGAAATAMVRGPSGGVPAYLRFSPNGAPEAIVEVFADNQGLVATRLLTQPHSVLIIPSANDIAPARIASFTPTGGLDTLDIAAGSVVSGSVVDPGGAALAGAKVQLSIAGVLSTVGTTAPDGSFTLLATSGSPVAVEVTPPVGSGLPRLSASSASFTLGGGIQIAYDPLLRRTDLTGLQIHRAGAAGFARVTLTVVGPIAGAGTVTAGTQATAAGDVRISVTTDTIGRIANLLVPEAALSGVVVSSSGDFTVVPLDTRNPSTGSLEAPAAVAIAPVVQGPFGDALAGAVLDAVPVGALAQAGAPPLHIVAGADGAAHAQLAAGGHYDLRLRDPVGRAAMLVVADRLASTVATSYRLPAALSITGMLMLGGSQPLAGASVQILCETCTGLDRARPIAEASSDQTGVFALAIPVLPTM